MEMKHEGRIDFIRIKKLNPDQGEHETITRVRAQLASVFFAANQAGEVSNGLTSGGTTGAAISYSVRYEDAVKDIVIPALQNLGLLDQVKVYLEPIRKPHERGKLKVSYPFQLMPPHHEVNGL